MMNYRGLKAIIFSLALMISVFCGGFRSTTSYAADDAVVSVAESEQEDETTDEEPDEEAVLGVRRENTEDSTDIAGRVITIIVAAGIGFAMIYIKRRKNGDR